MIGDPNPYMALGDPVCDLGGGSMGAPAPGGTGPYDILLFGGDMLCMSDSKGVGALCRALGGNCEAGDAETPVGG